ncbi:tripartite tricarboxylate transporter substrate-binding protein [Bordetella sp. LUAb4]|uniref:tripartite tricarboxylate transporter substrate-binding protein n=1 Tax=Bordetella sp. LUAb4 TaxID=2843195 RepID=UPI001E3C430B|nr:tripartite tricarboxylate transporter substrate-binding protein [Bordetella sp. LUAb4]
MLCSNRKVWAGLMAGSVMPFSAHSSGTEAVYPSRRITLVVGGSQGAGVDIISRHIARELEQELAVDVLVENRPGAAGNIAAEHVARSMPDGYTLLVTSRPNVTYGALQEHPRYDLRRALQPIGLMASAPTVVMAGTNAMIKTTAEMIARAKNHPLSVRCASGGIGSTGHLLCEELQQKAKVELMHVPYTHAEQAFNHMLGGHVDTVFLTLAAALPYIRAGVAHAIAISSAERVQAAPDIPTFAEEGFANRHGDAWFGLTTPTKTPADRVKRLNKSLNRVLEKSDLRLELLSLGWLLPSQPNSPEAFDKLIADEFSHWTDGIPAYRFAPTRH